MNEVKGIKAQIEYFEKINEAVNSHFLREKISELKQQLKNGKEYK